MTELIKTAVHYYTKDFSGYRSTENNFVANQELTLTITLNEYRDLVKAEASAKQRIDKAEGDRYERQVESEKLKKEVCDLKEKLYDLSSNAIAGEDEQQ